MSVHCHSHRNPVPEATESFLSTSGLSSAKTLTLGLASVAQSLGIDP